MNETILVELVKMSVQTAFILNYNWEGVFFDWEKRVFYVHYYGRERLTINAEFFGALNPFGVFLESAKKLSVRNDAKVVA